MSSETPIKDKLKEHVDKLSALLVDDYEAAGMMSWQVFVNSHWKAIVDLWNENYTPVKDPTAGNDRAFLSLIATQLYAWAEESVSGGWSTHQVGPQRKIADAINQYLARTSSTKR